MEAQLNNSIKFIFIYGHIEPSAQPVFKVFGTELTSRPEIAVFRKACLQGWPLLRDWKLNQKQSPLLIQNFLKWCVAYYASSVCTNNVLYGGCLLAIWESGILAHARRRCPRNHILKTLGIESPISFAVGNTSRQLSNFWLEGFSMSCVTPMREDSWRLVPLPEDFTPCASLYAFTL